MPTLLRGQDNFETEQYRSLQDRTWQDLTDSRLEDTFYTNSTGRDIEVLAVIETTTSSGGEFFIEVGGVRIVTTNVVIHRVYACSFTVPSGANYRIVTVSNFAVSDWSELR